MQGQILVVNAGSSSLKFALYQAHEALLNAQWRGHIDALSKAPRVRVDDGSGQCVLDRALDQPLSQLAALDWVLDWLATVTNLATLRAVGHRVVHGGMRHAGPTLLNPEVLAELHALSALAPLHQPHNLAAIERISERHPALAQVACFDTAFHRSNDDLVQRYALPEAMHQAGIRRYGFHGLSYAYIAGMLNTVDATAAAGKTIVLHLGAGASLCALRGGVSVASSMGFSTLDGIPMATRCGALDPGVILYLLRQGLSTDAIADLLYQQSGLLGVSGISGDLRHLSASNTEAAQRAIALMAYRVVREIGSLAAALGGLDALVFTAGIGQHSAAMRALVCSQLAWLGVELDPTANAAHRPRISGAQSRVSAWVIATDEEAVIARDTFTIMRSA